MSDVGAELVELALALPILLLLLLGVADFGFMLQAYGVVNNAAREGARLAIMEGNGFTTTVVQNHVASYISQGLPSGAATPTTTVANLDVSVPTVGASGNVTLTVHTKRVTVTYPYAFRFIRGIASLMGQSYGTVNMTAVATMRLEEPAE